MADIMSGMEPEGKSKLFRGFADPARLAVLETLCRGPRCVSELVESTGLLQPNLSMHLACLRECGLVAARRRGRFIYYELADLSVAEILRASDRLLKRVGSRIAACPRYRQRGPLGRRRRFPRRRGERLRSNQ